MNELKEGSERRNELKEWSEESEGRTCEWVDSVVWILHPPFCALSGFGRVVGHDGALKETNNGSEGKKTDRQARRNGRTEERKDGRSEGRKVGR